MKITLVTGNLASEKLKTTVVKNDTGYIQLINYLKKNNKI